MLNLTMFKVKKRTTQMSFRITEGKGVAYYEIGVHDNGEMIGIEYEDCVNTIVVIFYMAQTLEAKLDVELVRLGYEGYNVRLKVTKALPKAIDAEIDGFVSTLSFLKDSNVYRSVRRIGQEEEEKLNGAAQQNPEDGRPKTERSPDKPLPPNIRLIPQGDSDSEDGIVLKEEAEEDSKQPEEPEQAPSNPEVQTDEAAPLNNDDDTNNEIRGVTEAFARAQINPETADGANL